jgi:hypothetical protein
MRRYEYLPFLASVLVAPAFAGPGQDLNAICKSTEGVYGCEEYIKVPYGSEPITTCFDTSPCGVQILTNNRNICDLVEETLPSDANYIGGYTAWCHRAPEAMTAIKTDKSVWVDGKLKDAEYVPLARALGMEEVSDGFFLMCLFSRSDIINNRTGICKPRSSVPEQQRLCSGQPTCKQRWMDCSQRRRGGLPNFPS